MELGTLGTHPDFRRKQLLCMEVSLCESQTLCCPVRVQTGQPRFQQAHLQSMLTQRVCKPTVFVTVNQVGLQDVKKKTLQSEAQHCDQQIIQYWRGF